MNQTKYDPRPIVRDEFETLLDRLEGEDASRVKIITERPYKVMIRIQVQAHGSEEVGKIAVSWHQRTHAMLRGLKYKIKTIEIGSKYVRFFLAPDWAYYMEQKEQKRSRNLEMDDIIPI